MQIEKTTENLTKQKNERWKHIKLKMEMKNA